MKPAIMICVAVLCISSAGLGLEGMADSSNHTEIQSSPEPPGVDSGVAMLDKMVVTATRTSRRISETPVSVSVITRQEIESSPARNIDDLIMGETSVNIRRLIGIGEGIPSDINMRGIPGAMAASRTLILVDGIPTNASGTPFLILNEIPLEAVERVEIVRGPYSSLYGANALGGVVNVITKTGDGRPGGAGFVETSYPFSLAHLFALENGSHGSDLYIGSAEDGLWNAGGLSSGGTGKFNYLASGGYRRIGNYLLADSAFVRGPHGKYMKSTENYNYRDVRFFGKTGMHPSERLRIGFSARYFNSELGFGRTKKIRPDSVDIDVGGGKILVGPDVRLKINDFTDFRCAGYYRQVTGEYWNEVFDSSSDLYIPSYWESMSNDWQIESQIFFKHWHGCMVTIGGEYLRNAIDFGATVNSVSGDSIPGRTGSTGVIGNGGVYIQDEINLFERLNIVPGIRYDYHSSFGSAISPKLAAGYKLIDQVRIRGTAGRAFRAPTHVELYMPNLPLADGFDLKSNPNLMPEYLWAFDVAADIQPIPSVSLTVGGFYNLMNDLVVTGKDIASLAVTHQNTSDAWSRGIEFEAEWQAIEWMSIKANTVFQSTRDEHASDVRKYFGLSNRDVPLDYMPRQSAGLRLALKKHIGKLFLEGTISEEYVGERSYLEWTWLDIKDPEQIKVYFDADGMHTILNPPSINMDPYFRTDISVSAHIGRYITLNMMIQNLLDAQFEESGGSYAAGRFASIKVIAGVL